MSKFDLLANKTGRGSALTVDGQSVQNVNRAELSVPADGVTQLVVTQTFIQGTASGEAEVTFIKSLLPKGLGGAPLPPRPTPATLATEIQALAEEAAQGQHRQIGLGSLRLDDGSLVKILYFIPQEVAPAQESGDWGSLH
ncbi:hypothetical protein [Deinococcus sp. Leaf326]|uniref:hypothetical protein n=1 Tax=Deinococcus sp. Leaf326 TaxID=1736338 RepID=UPI0006F88BF4|nr:hypothetical protein [Deinococcus sp. Leaf326]KQR33124.1 hypothetical protein ASF71_16670 [Deinococcus sp. Leaf326]